MLFTLGTFNNMTLAVVEVLEVRFKPDKISSRGKMCLLISGHKCRAAARVMDESDFDLEISIEEPPPPVFPKLTLS